MFSGRSLKRAPAPAFAGSQNTTQPGPQNETAAPLPGGGDWWTRGNFPRLPGEPGDCQQRVRGQRLDAVLREEALAGKDLDLRDEGGELGAGGDGVPFWACCKAALSFAVRALARPLVSDPAVTRLLKPWIRIWI
jgi:hypothetical protein